MKYILIISLLIVSLWAGKFGEITRDNSKELIPLYIASANKGNIEDQFMLGEVYYLGSVVEPNCMEAIKWYELAAKHKNVPAQLRLGEIFNRGTFPNMTPTELQCYANAGSSEFMKTLKHDNTDKYEFKNNKYILKKPSDTDSNSKLTAYENFQEGLKAQEDKRYNEAFKFWETSANQGNAAAQYYIGRMYYYGNNVFTQDYKQAMKWYKLSAEQGLPEAQNSLGIMYDSGKGVAVNHKEALRFYTLSAKQGFAKAQKNIAYKYMYGRGVLQDYTKAEKWLHKAIKNGNNTSKCMLGIIYAEQNKYSKAKTIVEEGYNDGEDYCTTVWNRYSLCKH